MKEIENIRKESIENTIKAKEEKIQQLQRQREKTLEEGRIQAHITANLRENLRYIIVKPILHCTFLQAITSPNYYFESRNLKYGLKVNHICSAV